MTDQHCCKIAKVLPKRHLNISTGTLTDSASAKQNGQWRNSYFPRCSCTIWLALTNPHSQTEHSTRASAKQNGQWRNSYFPRCSYTIWPALTNLHSQTEHSTRATTHLKQHSQVLGRLHLVKAGLSYIRDRQWARNIIDTQIKPD
jgi:hypothetical protein